MAKAGKRTGERALTRRYGHRLEEIRREYAERAEGLKREARQLESDYQILARQFRKDVASLRRKGFIARSTDSRKATLTAQISKKLNDLHDVLTGKRRALKVKPVQAKEFREQGYPVFDNRVLLGPRYTVRKGHVYEREPKIAGQPKRRGSIIRLNANIEAQAETILSSLKPNEYIGLDIGAGFSQLFGRDDLHTTGPVIGFLDYLQGGGSFDRTGMKYVMVHTIPEVSALQYIYAREAERQRYGAEQRVRRNARRRDARSQKNRG
jgi:hypothetical protein